MKHFFFILRFVLLLFGLVLIGRAKAQCTQTALYVDSTNGVDVLNNGSSWNSSVKSLWYAITVANNNSCIKTIYVAKGTYKYTTNTDAIRDSAFTFKKLGLKIYGGYSAGGSTRDVTAYPTVLSGDIGTPGNNADNQYHVVVMAGIVLPASPTTTDSLVLDGFTITGGNANGSSTKIYNSVSVGRFNGGGIYITDCEAGRRIAIRNCKFNNNSSVADGGGAYVNDSRPQFRDCIFSACHSIDQGGGLYNYSSNTATNTCTFTGNTAGQGAAIYNYDSSANIVNCTFSQNISDNEGGGIYNFHGATPNISNCVFLNNSSSTRGGGAIFNYASAPNITRSFFSGNSCANNGGAIHNNFVSAPTIINAVFVSNSSGGEGGAVYNANTSTARLVNSTFFQNSSTNGGFISNNNSSPTITNCIVRSNAPQTPVIYNTNNSAPRVRYCLLQGDGYPGTGNINANALFVNSADPDGPDNVFGTADDGLVLQSLCSPAVNAGINDSIPPGTTIDATGAARIQGGTVDMGAYEATPVNTVQIAGSISGAHTIPYPQEDLLDYILSDVNSYSPAAISWQKSTDSTNWITDAALGNQEYIKIPQITTTTFFRRVTTPCGIPYYSNAVKIQVISQNKGVISGRVVNSQGFPVQGVKIQVTRRNALPGGPAGYTYTPANDSTDNNGYYSINSIYYGDPSDATASSDFIVKPYKAGHGFRFLSPSDTLKTLTSSAYNISNVNFTDTSAISFSGQVQQVCSNCNGIDGNTQSQTCPIDNITINRGPSLSALTYATTTGATAGDYGQYTISVTDPTTQVVIKPVLSGHSFTPVSQTVTPANNVSGIDFTDITTHTISGKLTAGCGSFIGRAVLEFADILSYSSGSNPVSCFRKRVTTDAGTGAYTTTLPARKYRVSVVSFTPNNTSTDPTAVELINFINNNVAADSLTCNILSSDTTLNITYTRPPVIAVTGLNIVCATPTPFALIRQAVADSFKVTVFQGTPSLGCPLQDTTLLKIMTNVQQEDQIETLQYPVADTGIKVKLTGGIPNIAAPYLKTLRMNFTDRYGRSAAEFSRNVLVTGIKSDPGSFTTVSPQVPLMVLHDPPGDASSSTWQQNKSISNAVRFYAASALGGDAWVQAKVGVATTVGVGVATDISVWGTIRGTIGINSTTTSSNEAILTTTTSQNFTTSNNSYVTGSNGDVYIGAALNLKYAMATYVGFNNCNITSTRQLLIGDSAISTEYVYSEDYIVNTLIPELRTFAQVETNTQARDRYLNQVKVWEQVVANNAENKRKAKFVTNYSFSGGGQSFTNTTTTTSSRSSSVEFSMELNASVAAELGFETAGSGVSGGVQVNFRMETGKSETNTVTDETTIGYTLQDNTPGDVFSVDVKTDPVYNTPVFDLVAGTSSCPTEPGTRPRDAVFFTADTPVVRNVALGSEALFTLRITNISPSTNTNPNDKRVYKLSYVQTSNVAGETIKIAGTAYNSSSPYITRPLGYLESELVTVSVTRASGSSVFGYENELFSVSSNCDEDLGKAVAVAAYFNSPCGNIGLNQPANGWQLSSASNNQIFIKPEYGTLTGSTVQLQYLTGNSSWRDTLTLTQNQIDNGFNFNTTSLPEGPVSFRLRLNCVGGGTMFSQRTTGIIDRIAPQLAARPTPSNDLYVNGDVISFTYNESLSTNPAGLQVLVRRLSSNQLLPVTYSISGSQIIVTPTGSIAGFTGDSIRVTITGVSDLYGNVSTRVDTTRFSICASVIATGNRALTLSITNPVVYKNGDSTINILFNLPVVVNSDVRVNYTISGAASYKTDYTVIYPNNSALYESFNGTTGSIRIAAGTRQAVLQIKPNGNDTSFSPDKTVIVNVAEGGDYGIGNPSSITGTITSEDGISEYVFTGDGNWNVRSNWLNQNMPLTTLTSGKKITIDPIGTCILNVRQTILQGATLWVNSNRQFIIKDKLDVKRNNP